MAEQPLDERPPNFATAQRLVYELRTHQVELEIRNEDLAEARDLLNKALAYDRPFEFPDQPQRGLTYWDWTLTSIRDASGKVEGLGQQPHITLQRGMFHAI